MLVNEGLGPPLQQYRDQPASDLSLSDSQSVSQLDARTRKRRKKVMTGHEVC